MGLAGAALLVRHDGHGLDEHRQQLVLDASVHLAAVRLDDPDEVGDVLLRLQDLRLRQLRHVRRLQQLGQPLHVALHLLLVVLEQRLLLRHGQRRRRLGVEHVVGERVGARQHLPAPQQAPVRVAQPRRVPGQDAAAPLQRQRAPGDRRPQLVALRPVREVVRVEPLVVVLVPPHLPLGVVHLPLLLPLLEAVAAVVVDPSPCVCKPCGAAAQPTACISDEQ